LRDWERTVTAEGLSEPTVTNKFSVYKATISKDEIPMTMKATSEDGTAMKQDVQERRLTLCSLYIARLVCTLY